MNEDKEYAEYKRKRRLWRKSQARRVQKRILGAAGQLLRLCFLLPWAVLMLLPLALLLSGSLSSPQELKEVLGPVLEGTEGMAFWRFFPRYPTGEHYRQALLYTPQFYIVFWNSVKITAGILVGQLLVGAPAAWALAVYRFRGSGALFTAYLVLMLLPFQVTMLSQYLVLDRLHLMNTRLAVILPAVFSTFPVFLMYRSFRGIPRGLLEAGRIDGAGEGRLFFQIGLPLASGGVLSAVVLGFLECWNLIEQPLAFLQDQSLWPLSLYLPQVNAERAGFSFALSVITLIPAVFVFLLGQDYLEKGIVASGLKE